MKGVSGQGAGGGGWIAEAAGRNSRKPLLVHSLGTFRLVAGRYLVPVMEHNHHRIHCKYVCASSNGNRVVGGWCNVCLVLFFCMVWSSIFSFRGKGGWGGGSVRLHVQSGGGVFGSNSRSRRQIRSINRCCGACACCTSAAQRRRRLRGPWFPTSRVASSREGARGRGKGEGERGRGRAALRSHRLSTHLWHVCPKAHRGDGGTNSPFAGNTT